MELTDRAHYLLTEYGLKVHPLIEQATDYLVMIRNLETADYSHTFDVLPEAEREAAILEMQASQVIMMTAVRAKIKNLCEQVIARATDLVTNQGDHITDMSSNVNANATIDGLSAQVSSMTGAASGITVGFSAGAAIVESLATPVIADLSTEESAKAVQVAAALLEVDQLVTYGLELENFIALVGEVLP